MDSQVLVAAIGISIVVFGVGGFALGWSAGKRAYRDRMPALDPEQVDTTDAEELAAVANKDPDATGLLDPDDEWDEQDGE